MEDIAPPLKLLLHLIQDLKNGRSLRGSINNLNRNDESLFFSEIKDLMFRVDQGLEVDAMLSQQASAYRKALMELVIMGLAGHPILVALEDLKPGLEQACLDEIDDHIKKLPFKLLLPMMIFLIPAYLLLIFGPIVKLFIKGVWL